MTDREINGLGFKLQYDPESVRVQVEPITEQPVVLVVLTFKGPALKTIRKNERAIARANLRDSPQ